MKKLYTRHLNTQRRSARLLNRFEEQRKSDLKVNDLVEIHIPEEFIIHGHYEERLNGRTAGILSIKNEDEVEVLVNDVNEKAKFPAFCLRPKYQQEVC